MRKRFLTAAIAVTAAVILPSCAAVHNVPGNSPLAALTDNAALGPGLGSNAETPSYTDDLLIGLAFSGGGTRAAAFSFGVLKELDNARLPRRTSDVALTDRIDFVSGVSGGSITAAYFGLKKRAALADFRERFLLRDAEAGMITHVGPATIAQGLAGGLNTDQLPKWLDANLFEGATFSSLRADRRPRIWINASDIYNRTPFVFGRTAFSVICSDLSSYRIANAVAASAAVPLVFAPVVLESYGDRCPVPLPDWATRSIANPSAEPMLRAFSLALQSYRNGTVKYIKLLDGGLVDNFGLSGFTIARQSSTTPYGPLTPEQAVRIRRAMFLVVDAGRAPSGDWTKTVAGPGGAELISAASDTAIDASVRASYTAFERTQNDWQQQIIRWRCGLSAAERRRLNVGPRWNCRDVKFFVGRVTFESLDQARALSLNLVPTRFKLPEESVDLVVQAGQDALRVNPTYRSFLSSLQFLGKNRFRVPCYAIIIQAGETELETEATRSTVRQLYDAYIKGDAERFASFLDDNLDWVIHAPIEVFAFAGPRKGKVAVLEALAGIADDYELKKYEPQVVLVDGERAAVMSEVGFVQRSSGRMLRFRIADFLRLKNGKVVEFREFTDTFDVTQQALGRFFDL